MNKSTKATSVYTGISKSALRFSKVDPERRIFLPSGKFTSPSALTPITFSLVILAIIYSLAYFWRDSHDWLSDGMGINKYNGIPIYIIALSVWSLTILAFKYFKIKAQKKALKISVVPESAGFVLSGGTVDQVIQNIETQVEEPRKFMLFNRILLVLKSIRNVGRIADIDDMLSSTADADDLRIENSYTVVRGFIWAIPVLGFIGTIVGLTETIGKFGSVFNHETGKANIEEMMKAMGGLDTAFYTTGIALVAALIIHLILTFIRKADDDLLDETREYCKTNIVTRVRV
jgi:biopolymer transport protein ExbB/TolQ